MKKFHSSIPLMFDEKWRDHDYWGEMRQRLLAQRCNRVFLVIKGDGGAFISHEHIRGLLPSLRETGAFFSEVGIEPAIWLGHTIGHGSLFSGDERAFQSIYVASPEGDIEEDPGVFCPLDAAFVNHISGICALLAESGLPMLMLDDDFRLSLHDQPYGCFCPLHMASFRQRSGMDITAEELAAKIHSDAGIRKIWQENNAESLYILAAAIEKAVHSVNPQMRLGVCATPQLAIGDGMEPDKIAAIMAGNTRPFLRFSGAPYWFRPAEHAGEIIEFSRLQQSWHKLPDIELFAEGDTHPHNTYVTSANMLEAFTEGLAASGVKGILTYQYSYGDPRTTDWEYEDITRKNLDFIDELAAGSPAGWIETGFEPVLNPGGFLSAEADSRRWLDFKPVFYFCQMAPRLGIPTAYRNPEAPGVLFGSEISACSDNELAAFLKRGAVIDAPAAKMLLARGFDLGIEALSPLVKPHSTETADSGITFKGNCRINNVFWKYQPRQEALVRLCSTFENGDVGIAHLKSADGNKVVFIPWDVSNAKHGNFSHLRQLQWREAYQFLIGEEQPLAIDGKADIRLHIRTSPDGTEAAASIQNLSLDIMRLSSIHIGAQWELVAWLPPGAGKTEAVDMTALSQQLLPQMRMCLLRLKRK